MKRLYGLLSFFTLSLYSNKMIILISPSLSLSTVFLKMMDNRGDFTVFNEPGMATFKKPHKRDIIPCRAYDHVIEAFKTAHESTNIFIKEMMMVAEEYLIQESFLNNPDCYFVFLVRNPHHSGVSYFKKSYKKDPSYKTFWRSKKQFPQEMNYALLHNLYEKVQQKGINKPYIIIADHLIKDPQTVITDFCNHVGIDMKEEYLHWQACNAQFSPQQQWHDSKSKTNSYFWHDVAIASTHITTASKYAVNEKNEPTFEEIEDLEVRGFHKGQYYFNKSYYDYFVKVAAEQY